jgi:hypothetical protein
LTRAGKRSYFHIDRYENISQIEPAAPASALWRGETDRLGGASMSKIAPEECVTFMSVVDAA